MELDVIQEHVLKKVHCFVGTEFEYLEPGKHEPEISLNQREAYIVLKLFKNKRKTRIFSKYKTKGFWWFRVFGYGLSYVNLTNGKLSFSERNGFSRYIKIGRWSFRWING